ncbi:MAG: DUF1573 domain-containing protein [Bacteroidales bacterium]|nr:DUF1573 domain-containing protein [Bacteroidales bacterium]
MNRILTFGLIILIAFTSNGCQSNEEGKLPADLVNNPISAEGKADLGSLPKFQFVTMEHDFGKLIEGVKVSFKFKYKNVGGSDLLINQVKTSCGCTASSYSKDPLPPGGTSVIELTFDSNRQPGKNFKNATIIANTQPNVVELKIRAEVVKPENF